MSADGRILLVDASVWITLSKLDCESLLKSNEGQVLVPTRVVAEITSEPAQRKLDAARNEGWIDTERISASLLENAAPHLGNQLTDEPADGDVALLARALRPDNPVVITDDKPLRDTCKALSISVSGSIGVLIRAVERDAIKPERAKSKLYAMDEAGARLSASLVKRAAGLIEDASD